MATKVYKYGLLAPSSQAELVAEQIFLAHREYNARLRVELSARDALRAGEDPSAVKLARNAARSTINRSSAVYWGTKGVVAARIEAACGSTPLTEKLPSYRIIDGEKVPLYGPTSRAQDPRFRRWDGTGQIGLQIQGRMALSGSNIHEDNQWCWIEPLPQTGSKRQRHRTVLHLRVGSKGRDPIWATWPMVMHRPLPPGRISMVKVNRLKVGPRTIWTCDITVEVADAPVVENGSKVAVDLGWRQVDHGYRVAYWVGDDGRHGEVVLPYRLIEQMEKTRDLERIRAGNMSDAVSALLRNLGEIELPEWFRSVTSRSAAVPTRAQACARLCQWTSEARLGSLCRRWAQNRFDGDTAAFEALEKWRYHDYHLWQWQSSQFRSFKNSKAEVYKVLASRLAKEYDLVVLEDMKLSAFARKNQGEKSNASRQLVGTYDLRNCVGNAFGSGRQKWVDPKMTSRTCSICGYEHPEVFSELQHTCEGCSQTWDRDWNAGHVMLERSSNGKKTRTARTVKKRINSTELGGSRHERMTKAKASRLVKSGPLAECSASA